MKEEEIEKVLDELNSVRPEMLNEKAKRLFNAIMSIADERDLLKEKYNKALKLLDKTELLPCENFEDWFDYSECDYCNSSCSNADTKCWDNFIKEINLKGDSNE